MEKNIVIIANSPKGGGRCVAGIDIENKQFIRLISENNSLSIENTRYSDGTYAHSLDLVKVDVIKHCPQDCHQEDWAINSSFSWQKLSQYEIDDLAPYMTTTEYLFLNPRNKLELTEASSLSYSILLAHLSDIRIYINEFNKIKADFIYNRKRYRFFSVTDLPLLQRKNDLSISGLSIKEALATITLASVKDSIDNRLEYCFKFLSNLIILKN